MSKNVGFTKKEAEELAKNLDGRFGHYGCLEAYAQKEEHSLILIDNGKEMCAHEYIVVLRKRRDK